MFFIKMNTLTKKITITKYEENIMIKVEAFIDNI